MDRCQVCEAQTPDGFYLCRDEQDKLLDALHGVPGLLEDLDTAISRQDTVTRDTNVGAAHGKMTEAPMPYRVDVADSRRELGVRLGSWCAALGLDYTEAWVPKTTSLKDPTRIAGKVTAADKAARLLAESIDRVARMSIAGEVYSELMVVIGDCVRAIDIKTLPRYVGTCDCGGQLYAKHKAWVMVCPSCGVEVDIEQKHHEMQQRLNDHHDTAPNIAGLLRISGIEIGTSTVQRWAAQGKIICVGLNDRGRNLYSYRQTLWLYRMLHNEIKPKAS